MPPTDPIAGDLPLELAFLPHPAEAGRIGRSKPSRKAAARFVNGLIQLLVALANAPESRKREALAAVLRHARTVYRPGKKGVSLRARSPERAAYSKAAAGYYSSAMKVLLSAEMTLTPGEIDQKLEEMQATPLHDPQTPALTPHTDALTSFEITFEAVDEALGRMRADSAPGPSGLSFLHLKLAHRLRKGKLVQALLPLVRDIIAGEEYTSILAHARLIALPKGQDRVRPIAMGESLRRLAAKVLASAVSARLRDDGVCPEQYGLGESCGLDIMTNKIAEAYESGHKVCAVDMSNAYGTVSRAHLHAVLQAYAPAALPYFTTMYRGVSPPSNSAKSKDYVRGWIKGQRPVPVNWYSAPISSEGAASASCPPNSKVHSWISAGREWELHAQHRDTIRG
ncbi:Retrotransposable element SLACS kDa protein [Carpediemonas membranifera]|uniref:Retrotransposable element SLACS kDa protein n=1 Tax=Carpediemonas membranifera TaxID=201153 RepID=A0A8J6AUE1_9EUKA|nr:Retrotransposable element SLACS kDa protein [Carpediemonas membranifera]|eukprot:KAG9394423.1 Retrotransposable element SLACS kDa protein [Carpediemonas membranifera]